MLKAKRILSFVLTLALLTSMCAFVTTAHAASVDTAAAQAEVETEESSVSKITSPSDFSWDNASVYFLLTDRFYNGNTSNDHSYGRSLNQSGAVTYGNSDAAAFHGGDFAGITKKINEGYFDDLGVNALWISAPYEQIHGYCIAGSGKSGSFPHYSYHGYYAGDFSQADANFGTEEEFETMVDTAHEHGIRIVLDVVMNHVGYNTLKDMSEYNFGTLKSGWENGYYNATLTNVTYHQYIDYNNGADNWARWWGSSWLRAGLAGYKEGSGDLEGCQTFLPDLKENVTSAVDVPAYLKTKWSKEGTLSTKTAELNNYFSSTGKTKNVRNYLVYWLSQWVEKYGVDGFRCDTAKHVTLDSWKALKDQCVTSLKTWRQNNPDKPGADWDEDFWTTGECYTHYLSYDSYYTSGGFDSMINFSFNDSNRFDAGAPGVPGVSSINSTYANYAGQLNTNDKYNVLSYLSSHDTRLCRNNMIYQGSAFQLLPGGIQIFYGDESNRPLVSGKAAGLDHAIRSDMNWNSMDKTLLAHWQKVGQFRNNHVAVGAGSHKNLSATSGAAFARTYDKGGVTDKIAACIGASNNTNVTITLNGTFADGTVVKNAYDGKTATVSGGKVTFNSGANGTILVEADGSSEPVTTAPATEPATTAAPTEPASTTPPFVIGEYMIGDADMNGKVNIIDAATLQLIIAKKIVATDAQKKIADADQDGELTVNDVSMIQCYLVDLAVEGSKVGQKIKVEVPATVPVPTTQPTTTPVTTTATLPETEPQTEPPIPYGTVKFTDNQKWGTVYAYFFSDDQVDMAGAWPGTPMTFLETNGYGEDVYISDIPAGATKVVFNNGTAQTVDVTLSGGEEGYYTDGSQTEGKFNVYPWSQDIPVTGPTPIPDGTVKFTDNQKWGTVYAYFFSDDQVDMAGAWPGTPMTFLETNGYGEDVYTVDIPAGATKVVFNNGTAQTVDVTLSGEEGYYTDGTQTEGKFNVYPWSQDIPGPGPGPTPAGTIKFTDNQNWGTVYAYFWSDDQVDMAGAWPGAQMTSAGTNDFGENIYSVDIPAGATKVIFSNGTAQTVDITLSGEEGYYTDGTQTDGKFNAFGWSQDTPDPGPGPTPTPAGTVKFTDNQNWGTVYAYFWSDDQVDMAGAWPGAQMTSAGTNDFGENIYSVDIPAGATKVIFTNGTAQTVDITLSGEEGYYTDGTQTDGKFNAFGWSSGSTGGGGDIGGGDVGGSGTTVKFTDNQGWGETGTISAYFFSDDQVDIGGAWPGIAMGNPEDNGMGQKNYSVEIPAGATKVIFTNGTDQTEDITLSGYEGYYTDGQRNAEGKLLAYGWNTGGTGGGDIGGGDVGGSGTTVKFTDNQGWGETGTISAYFFSDGQVDIGGAWPGIAMGNPEDNGMGQKNYSVEIPAGATKVIFSNGTDQTEDITLGGYEGYYTDGQRNAEGKLLAYGWNTGGTGGGGDIGGGDVGGSGTTVKFTDNQKWGTVYAYFFSDSQVDMAGGWPGTPMTFLETNGYGENVYTVEVPAGATKVIFSNGTAQTVDTDLTGAEGYYTDGSQTDGKFNALPWA